MVMYASGTPPLTPITVTNNGMLWGYQFDGVTVLYYYRRRTTVLIVVVVHAATNARSRHVEHATVRHRSAFQLR